MKYIFTIIALIVAYLVFKSKKDKGVSHLPFVPNNPTGPIFYDSDGTDVSWGPPKQPGMPTYVPAPDPREFSPIVMRSGYFATMPPSEDLRTVASKSLQGNQY